MSDTKTKSLSPNGIESYDGEHECSLLNCEETADWKIALIDRHGQTTYTWSCDDDVEEVWGYHPEEVSNGQ